MKSGELIYRTGRGGRSNIIILFSEFEEGELRYVTVKRAAEDRPADANSNQYPLNSPIFWFSGRPCPEVFPRFSFRADAGLLR